MARKSCLEPFIRFLASGFPIGNLVSVASPFGRVRFVPLGYGGPRHFEAEVTRRAQEIAPGVRGNLNPACCAQTGFTLLRELKRVPHLQEGAISRVERNSQRTAPPLKGFQGRGGFISLGAPLPCGGPAGCSAAAEFEAHGPSAAGDTKTSW